MSETQKIETKHSAKEETEQSVQEKTVGQGGMGAVYLAMEEMEQSVQEKTVDPREWVLVGTLGETPLYKRRESYFHGKSPFVLFPTAIQIVDEGESSGAEAVAQNIMQAECVRLSGYINSNISDIIKLREENDRLSEELRMAMAKLRAA